MRGVLALLLALCAGQAWAQTPEAAYFDVRNSASAELKQMGQDPEYNPSKDLGKPELFTAAFRKEYDRRRHDVEVQLTDLLAPLPALPGYARVGVLNPSLCCYGRFGALDGLSFEGTGPSAGNRVIVSTEGLLRHWLNESTDFWPIDKKPSNDLPTLFATPSFYLWSRASDWPVQKLVDLPIGLVDNATAINAFLASAQPDATWLALSVAKGGLIYVAFFKMKTRTAPIAACEGAAPAAYRDCWSKEARRQPWYDDLLLEAVAFADALPG
jgi:hypothetical protein